MVATPAMIAQVSEHTVSDTGNAIFTTALFNVLSPIAQALLDEDNPGLPASIYDYCHALLIAHLYSVKKGQTGYVSQSANGYSVSRKVGETAYLVEYREMLKRWQAGLLPTITDLTVVQRSDAKMDGLQLDEADIPSFFTEV